MFPFLKIRSLRYSSVVGMVNDVDEDDTFEPAIEYVNMNRIVGVYPSDIPEQGGKCRIVMECGTDIEALQEFEDILKENGVGIPHQWSSISVSPKGWDRV